MYDILELKTKLLPELQEIAKKLNVNKYRTLKKIDLIYQILDLQAIKPKEKIIPILKTQIKKITRNIIIKKMILTRKMIKKNLTLTRIIRLK